VYVTKIRPFSSYLRQYSVQTVNMSTLHPFFACPGCEVVVLDDILALPSSKFVADDLMVGVSVLTGRTTSGYIRSGVVTEVIPGIGVRFDNPDQNGIFWRDMWQHLGDCECTVCVEHRPQVYAYLNQGAAAIDSELPPPGPPLRRTDSGSDYSFNGYPDCEFWERSGYAPLFIATATDYNGGCFLVNQWTRGEVAQALREVDVTTLDGPARRAYERQQQELQDATELVPEWGGCGVPSFMEQPLTPPRTLRLPPVCPGAPARLRQRRGAIPFMHELDEVADDDTSFQKFLRAPVRLRVPMWSLGAGLLGVCVYMLMVVFQLESCRSCRSG
jgi:hypothetical protein